MKKQGIAALALAILGGGLAPQIVTAPNAPMAGTEIASGQTSTPSQSQQQQPISETRVIRQSPTIAEMMPFGFSGGNRSVPPKECGQYLQSRGLQKWTKKSSKRK